MNWKFWKSKRRDEDDRDEYGDRRDPSACRHDWTNWTDPIEATVKTPTGGMFSTGPAEDREFMMQSRRCLKCNQFERRYA